MVDDVRSVYRVDGGHPVGKNVSYRPLDLYRASKELFPVHVDPERHPSYASQGRKK